MKNLVVFGGTTEGRLISEALSREGIYHTLCVATRTGEEQLLPGEYAFISVGRKNEDDIKALFIELGTHIVVDATHPYAKEVSRNIKTAADSCGVEYWRFQRDTAIDDNLMDGDIELFDCTAECAAYLTETSGNILLTTGSKTLNEFCSHQDLRERIYARVLPALESFETCRENRLLPKQIIAMQGPFSEELNCAMIREFDIKILVTKSSGKAGGMDEKLKAARSLGIKVCIINS